jgi:perosamine synthetase
MNILKKINYIFFLFLKSNFYTFSVETLKFKDLRLIKKYILYEKIKKKNDIDFKFEKLFKKKVGKGNILTFGAGRMAFYFLIKNLNFKRKYNDILLPSITCSVMVNAAVRAGYNPIFYDLDNITLGSSLKNINEKITNKTKIIVAQHTYGIPCEIDHIQKYCKKNNYFLIEDCALSYGSKYKGKFLGNFGDISIFSFDRSKPINTFTGGLLYTKNIKLFNLLKKNYNAVPSLNFNKQIKIYYKIILDCFFSSPKIFPKFYIIELMLKKFKILKNCYLNSDYTDKFHNDYEYPCKYPLFLKKIAIIKLTEFNKIAQQRKEFLKSILSLLINNNLEKTIPLSYFNNNNDIVPLRILLFKNKFDKSKLNFLKYFDENSFWYSGPIDSCPINPKKFGYKTGSCINLENNLKNFINLPCNHNKKNLIDIEKIIKKNL